MSTAQIILAYGGAFCICNIVLFILLSPLLLIVYKTTKKSGIERHLDFDEVGKPSYFEGIETLGLPDSDGESHWYYEPVYYDQSTDLLGWGIFAVVVGGLMSLIMGGFLGIFNMAGPLVMGDNSVYYILCGLPFILGFGIIGLGIFICAYTLISGYDPKDKSRALEKFDFERVKNYYKNHPNEEPDTYFVKGIIDRH